MFSYGFWLPHTALLLWNLACQGRARRSWVSREAEGEPGCFTTKGQNHKCREYVQVSCWKFHPSRGIQLWLTNKSSGTQTSGLLFVPSQGEGAVDRNRPGRQFRSVPGIRKWHCVKSLPQQEKVLTRHRSCYCTDCILDEEDQYKNKEWVDDWKEVEIKREASPATTR